MQNAREGNELFSPNADGRIMRPAYLYAGLIYTRIYSYINNLKIKRSFHVSLERAGR